MINNQRFHHILHFTEQFLSHRPAFFAWIRPLELELIKTNLSNVVGPILDYGCGDGFFTSILGIPKDRLFGCDIPISRVQNKSIYKKIFLVQNNKINIKDGYFHTIFSNSVLEHVDNLPEVLGEIFRVLHPKGRVLFTVMTSNWSNFLLGKKLLGSKYANWLNHKQQHLNLLTDKQWRNLFSKYGFKVVKHQTYLSEKLVRLNEFWHYLSLPSLLSYKIFGKWIIFPFWHKPLGLAGWVSRVLINDKINTSLGGGASFYLLEKKSV